VFGDNFEFTDNTYANLSTTLGTLQPLTFHSFTELKKAIGDSRVYAGIHYAPSCAKGIQLGEKSRAECSKDIEVFERVKTALRLEPNRQVSIALH
jgi:hypothetical protein